MLTPNDTEIVSGGAKGGDSCAAEYAEKTGKESKIILCEEIKG